MQKKEIPNVVERLSELIRQGCEAKGVTIIQGSIGKEHAHILISCTPSIYVSEITRYLKGRSSRLLQEVIKLLNRDIGDNNCELGVTSAEQ